MKQLCSQIFKALKILDSAQIYQILAYVFRHY